MSDIDRLAAALFRRLQLSNADSDLAEYYAKACRTVAEGLVKCAEDCEPLHLQLAVPPALH